MLQTPCTYNYQRKPLAIILVAAGIAVILAISVYCLSLSSEPANIACFPLVTTAYLWMVFPLLRISLVGPIKLRVGRDGLEVISIARAVSYAWSDIIDIRWRPAGTTYDPSAIKILIRGRNQTSEIAEGNYSPGEIPLMEAILKYWTAGVSTGEFVPQSPVRRWSWLCILHTLATSSVLFIGILTGWFATTWTTSEILVYPTIMLAFVAIIFLLPASRIIPRELEGYRPIDEFHDREIQPVTINPIAESEQAAWLSRKLFPTRDKDKLTHAEIRSIEHRAKQFDARVSRIAWICTLAFMTIGTFISYHINQAVEGPTINAIISNRVGAVMIWMGASFMLGCSIILTFTTIYCRRYYPKEHAILERYESSVKGYYTSKTAPLAVILSAIVGIFFALSAWNFDDVIDERGIRFKPGLVYSYFHPYEEVRGIEIYRQLQAPLGIRSYPNLRVTFSSGPEFTYVQDRGTTLREDWQRAVDYISRKSGVSIIRGDIRPDAASLTP